MRAGAFAETRVIDLLNRRFVPYYVNTGGPGLGKSAEAMAFLANQPGHPQAFLKAFAPDGTYLGSSEIYADKDAVFGFLRGVLDKHAEFDAATPEEARILAAGRAADAPESARLAAAELLEELGRYAEAEKLYASAAAPAAALARARLARYRKDWASQNEALGGLRGEPALAADVAVEDGYRLIGQKKYEPARRLLQAAAREHEASSRSAELHFYAGIACWFAGDKSWARFHWCWVLDNREADRLYRRAYIAAADDAMPYPNLELGRKDIRPYPKRVGIPMIVRAVTLALQDYDPMLALFEAGRFTGEPDGSVADDATAAELAARLKDAEEFRVRNHDLAARLVAFGKPSVDALVAVLKREGFRGRGWATWTLALVLREVGERPPEAMRLLRAAAADTDPAVRKLGEASLRLLARGS